MGRFLEQDPLWPRGGVNAYSYVLNDPIKFVDPNGLYTTQLGISASGTLWGVTVNFGFGIAVDDKGNFTTYYNYAGGAGAGAGLGGGTSVQISNANTVYDLAGPFATASFGAGVGVDAQVDMFGGLGTYNQLVTGAGVTLGVGLGASAAVTYGPTKLGPVANLTGVPVLPAQPNHCP